MSGRLRTYLLMLCALAVFARLPAPSFGQAISDSTRIDSLHGPYAGYGTWKEYLRHQDTLPRRREAMKLAWLTLGVGSASALPYQFANWAVVLGLTYEQSHLLYRIRFLDARDYNFASNPESLDEFDAMFGVGLYEPIFVNASIGIGYRYRNHYLSDPYQGEVSNQPIPQHAEVSYFALPLQAECFIPVGKMFGVGLTYYGTLTHEGFDRGLLLCFSLGKLKESADVTSLPPLRPGHP